MFRALVVFTACLLIVMGLAAPLRAQEMCLTAEYLVIEVAKGAPAGEAISSRFLSVEALTELRKRGKLVQQEFLSSNVRVDKPFEVINRQGPRTFKVSGSGTIVTHQGKQHLDGVQMLWEELDEDRVLSNGLPVGTRRFVDTSLQIESGKTQALGGTQRQRGDGPVTYCVLLLRVDEIK